MRLILILEGLARVMFFRHDWRRYDRLFFSWLK
jgi:hypothetical protein